MEKHRSACTISTWTAADATITTGSSKFYGLIALGSAAASIITIKDSATARMAIPVGITAGVNLIFNTPLQFTGGIVIDITGTASYAVLYA